MVLNLRLKMNGLTLFALVGTDSFIFVYVVMFVFFAANPRFPFCLGY